MNFDKIKNVSDKHPTPCTYSDFQFMASSIEVQRAILSFRHGNATAKKSLPGFCFHAGYGGKERKDCNAVPSGMVMLDFDHLTPEELEEIKAAIVSMTQEESSVVRLAHITPSGKGLRVVIKATRQGAFAPCRSIGDYQKAFARLLGYEDKLDTATKDFARISFCPLWEEVFYIDKELFSEEPEVTSFSNSPRAQKKRMAAELMQPLDFAGEPTQTHYRGIALKDIGMRYFEMNGGLPEEGARNQKLFSAACDLRLVCDLHPENIFHALPHVGLPPEEVMALCRSACEQPRSKHIPRRLQKVLDAFNEEQLEELEELEELAEVQDFDCETDETGGMTDEITDDTDEMTDEMTDEKTEKLSLPGYIIRPLLMLLPPDFREAGLLALLPIIGTLATGVRGRYIDGELHSPSFITNITAEQASGKSFVRYFVDLLLAPIDEQDDIYREMERKYQKEVRRAKTPADIPDEPETSIRNIPGTISVAKMLHRLAKAKGLHLFSFVEELDTIMKSNSAGTWSDKSDIYRVGFDNAKYGRDFVCDGYSIVVNVYYNLLSLGTPRQRDRFFGDVENGLVSRTCFARLPDQFGAKFVRTGKLPPDAKRAVMASVKKLMDFSGEVDMCFLYPVIGQWLEEQRMLAVQEGNRARDTFRRRASVIAFRAVMMMVPLYKITNNHVNPRLFGFYRSVADLVLREQLDFAGEQLNKVLETDAEMQTCRKQSRPSLYNVLPEAFGINAINNELSKQNMRSPARQFVYHWLKNGLIEKVDKGVYKKLH